MKRIIILSFLSLGLISMAAGQSVAESSNTTLVNKVSCDVKACSSAEIEACLKTCTPEQLAKCMKQCKVSSSTNNTSSVLGAKFVAHSPVISIQQVSGKNAKTSICSLPSSCCKKSNAKAKVIKL